MAASDRILQRWASVRRPLRHSPWVVGLLTVVALVVLMQTASVPHGMSESVIFAVMGGFIAGALVWFLLRSGVDHIFDIVFSLWRGRCPACRAWFTQSTVAVPGAIVFDYSLPAICPSCGVRLR